MSDGGRCHEMQHDPEGVGAPLRCCRQEEHGGLHDSSPDSLLRDRAQALREREVLEGALRRIDGMRDDPQYGATTRTIIADIAREALASLPSPEPTQQATKFDPFKPLDHGPGCNAARPEDRTREHCTCKWTSGHDGNHRCNCGFEWEQDNPFDSMPPEPTQ